MSDFRAAIAAPTAETTGQDTPSGPTPADKADPSPGLFTHKAIKGVPLTVSKFNLQTFWDSDTADMKEGIESLDDWVIDKARERGLEDKTESYQEIIDGILDQIGRSDNEKPLKTYERVQKAVEAYRRLEEAKLPKILDVHNLTADEYKKTRA